MKSTITIITIINITTFFYNIVFFKTDITILHIFLYLIYIVKYYYLDKYIYIIII